jgi:hypothetical protein
MGIRRAEAPMARAKLYGFVISLAIAQSIQSLLIEHATCEFVDSTKFFERRPSFLALVAVLVPFYHGMNRHLDVCYIEHSDSQNAEGALLFDFFIFFVDSCLLFAVAFSIGRGLLPYVFLGSLLAVDSLWALISHWIHYKNISASIRPWSVINAITIVASCSRAFRSCMNHPGFVGEQLM